MGQFKAGNPGRPKGSKNKTTEEFIRKVIGEGITPLEHMLAVMRDEKADRKLRARMAIAAAPYVHRRRQQTVEADEIAGQNIVIQVVQYDPASPPDDEADNEGFVERVHCPGVPSVGHSMNIEKMP